MLLSIVIISILVCVRLATLAIFWQRMHALDSNMIVGRALPLSEVQISEDKKEM